MSTSPLLGKLKLAKTLTVSPKRQKIVYRTIDMLTLAGITDCVASYSALTGVSPSDVIGSAKALPAKPNAQIDAIPKAKAFFINIFLSLADFLFGYRFLPFTANSMPLFYHKRGKNNHFFVVLFTT